MARRNIIITLLIASFANCYGQESTSFLQDWHLGISYFGNNLWNPGLQFLGEKVIKEKMVSNVRKDKTKIKFKQHVIDAKLGFYYDNPTHLAMFNNYTYNFRRVRNKGKFISIGAGPGVTRVFLPETYTVNNQGKVEKVKFPGRTYFTPVFSLGTGRLWKRSGTNPWQLKIHTFVQLNHNNGFLPLLNVEYGYLFGYKSKEITSNDEL